MGNAALRKATNGRSATVRWHRSLRRHALWAAMALALGVPTGQAQTVVTDGGTRTGVVTAPNGVPVVDIAAPNGKGLSHNTYQQFNVGSNGLILNNSGAVSNTQLAGYIGGNPNLGAGQAALLILNEVTSTAPSQLNGAMEVAGHAAQVVVANPNGITCSGCGFINALRGTLTTGRPLFAGDGSLGGLAVAGGTITIEGPGLPGTATDQVDLLARAVAINAGVWARQLNVVTGSNQVDFSTLATQPLSATGATPSVALDVSALGGMYANAIHLIGTEAGLGVNSQGKIIAQNGDLTLTSAGQVVLAGKTTATGNVTITAAQSLTNQGTLAAGGSVMVGSGAFTNQGVLYGNNAITLSAHGAVSNSGQIEALSGALTVQAQGAITGAAGSSVYAGGPINLSGASFGNAGKLESAQGFALQVSGDAANSGSLSADAGNFNLGAATIENTGSLAVGGDAVLQAGTNLTSSGTLVANGAVTLIAPSLTTAGTVQAGRSLGLSGNTLTNSGGLYALNGAWAAALGGAFVNLGSGAIYGSQNVTLTAASIANLGGIEAQQGGVITATGAFTNSGTLQSDQADLALQVASLANSGTLSAQRNLQVQTSDAVQNSGVLVSGQAFNLSSTTLDNQASGQIQSGTDATFSADTLDNEGVIDAKGNATLSGTTLGNAAGALWLAAGAFTLNQTGAVSNAGVLQAGGNLSLLQATSFTNSGTLQTTAGNLTLTTGTLASTGVLGASRNATLSANGGLNSTGTLLAGGAIVLTAPTLITSGTVQAGSSLVFSGNTLTNNGKLYALDGGWTATLSGAFANHVSGAIYGSQDVTLTAASLSNAGGIEARLGDAITLSGTLINSGTLQSDQADLVLNASVLNNSGTLSANRDLQVQTSGAAQNSGVLVSGRAFNLSSSAFDNQAKGQIQSGTDTNISAATLSNEGAIDAKGNAALAGTTLSNAAGAQWLAAGSFTFNQAGDVTNAGVLQAGGNLDMQHAASLTSSGTLQSTAGNLALATGTLASTGTLSAYGNAVLSASISLSSTGNLLANGAVTLTAPDLTTAGTVQAGSSLNLGGTTLSNRGKLYALNGAWNAALSGAVTNQSGGAIYGSQYVALTAASLTNAGGIEAQLGDTITLSGTLTNSGTLQSDQADLVLNVSALSNSGTLSATRNLQVQASGAVRNSGVLVGGQVFTLSSGAFDNQAKGQLQSGNDTNISAATLSNEGIVDTKGNALLSGTTLSNAAGAQWFTAGAITFNQTGDVSNAGVLQAGGSVDMQHAVSLTNGGTLQTTAGDLALNVGTLDSTGTLGGNGNVALTAGSRLSGTGTLFSGGTLAMTATQLVTAGTVEAGGALTLGGGTLSNNGKLYALGGHWTATLSGAFTNLGNGDIYGSQGLTLDAAALTSAGGIEAQQAADLTVGGAFANSGKLQSDQSGVTISASSLTNSGTLSASQTLQWKVGNTALNSNVLVSGRAMNLSSGSFDNQAGGQIQSGTDLALSAATLDNEGTVNAKGDAVLSGLSLSNAGTGRLLAAGTLTVGETGSVSNAGVLQAGIDFNLTQAASFGNAAGATLYARQDFNLALGQALTNAGMLYAVRTGTLSAGSVDNTGTLRSGGNLALASAGGIASSGAIQAQQALDLHGGGDFANSGKLYAIDGALDVQFGGVFDAAAGSDIYSGAGVTFGVGSFANGGMLEAKQAIGITAVGSVDNSGTLQADSGNLIIGGVSLSNQGTLSAAGATQLTSAGSLDNNGKLVTSQTLAVTAASFTSSGQIQSGGHATLQAASIVNGGLLQTGGGLSIVHNVTLTNQSGSFVLAAGNVSADTSSLLSNGGVIQAGGNLAIDGAGAVSNSAGATLYGTQLTTLQLGGGLSNAGMVYGAQGVNLTAASLDNSGSLRSGATLAVATQVNASNTGTTYAAGTLDWNIGGALANTGVLAGDGNVTLQAASLGGNGTLAAGLQSDGTLGTTGDLAITTTGNLAANGRSLAVGTLRLAGSAIDLSGSQTRANNIALTASQGNVTNAGGDLAANGTVAVTTQTGLVNGGTMAAQGGKISAGTLLLQAAALDNRYGLLIQTGTGDLGLSLAGTFANTNGTLATNARNLTVHAATIDNTAGTIQDAGNGTLGITTPGDLTNTGGRIAGNGALALQVGGVLGNDNGLLSVAGDVMAATGSIDNVHGTLIGQNLGLTVAQALTNTGGGTIQAGGALQLEAGSVDNTVGYIKVTDAQSLTLTTSGLLINGAGGFIGGNGTATVNAGSLVNLGQVYAGNTLGVTTQGLLTNDRGALQAQGAASVASSGALSNRGGRIEAGSGNAAAGLNVRAASLDNTAGRIANTGQGASTFTLAQGAVNEGGTLGGQGAVMLTAASLDNSQAGKLVAGQALTLGLGSLDNTAGSIYAASDFYWANGNASLENARGSLQAGGNLSLDLASLDNADGTIATNQNGNLSLGRFIGLGKVAAGQDLSLTLGGDYTNVTGSQLSANRNLTLNVAGDFANAAGATLQAVNQLTVNAANIDNAAGATLNSAATVLATGGALSNEGSIEGNTITLNAGSLTNTANIIGGSLTVTTGSLTNGADLGMATGNNPYQSALIAAANGIDLYVSGTVLNRDATVFTLGNLTIGANASGGYSQAVTNLSGDIEANGGIAIDADQYTNQRRVFQTTTYNLTAAEQAQNTTTGVPLVRYLYTDVDPNHQPPNVTTAQVIGSAEFAQATAYCNANNYSSSRCVGYPNGVGAPVSFQSTSTYTVTSVATLQAASAEGKLVAGGNITLNGSVLNDKSTIAAGNNLIINGQNGNSGGGSTSSFTVQNIAWMPTAQVTESTQDQTAWQYLQNNPRTWIDGGWWTYGTTTGGQQISLAPGAAPSWVTYNAGAGLAASMAAGNTVSITAQTINNTAVNAGGQPVQAAIGLGANGGAQTVGGSVAGVVASASSTSDSMGSAAVGSAPGQASGVSLGLATVRTISAASAPGATSAQGLGLNGASAPTGVSTQATAPARPLGTSAANSPQAGTQAQAVASANTAPALAGAPAASHTVSAVSSGTALPSAPQVVSTLVGPNADVRLPQPGLYTVTTQPGSPFLVETSPQFTQYNNFISSNYLLQQLGLDPQQTEQRLGDGFYEQQQVLAQITDLTGRRYLADNTDALGQYRELMNNAVGVAKQFDLSVGVALTPEQMAILTQDIVWLVNVTVDGHQVLEPVVYLSAADAKNLAASGATIAGKDVILTASGDITNNGTIAASQNAQLTASNLLNGGTIRAGNDLSINAAQDILNGSTLQAGGNVSLVAGNDVLGGVNVAQRLGSVALPGLGTALGPVALTNLSIPGSISAGGNLSISAGRDLTLDTAPIAVGSNLSLAAGRDLTATATAITAGGDAQLLASRDLILLATGSTNRIGTPHDSTETTLHTVDTLQAGGTLSLLAGHDLAGQGAQITATTLNLAAGHDLNLAAVTDSTMLTSQDIHGHTVINAGQTDQSVRGTTLNGAQGVAVLAGNDLTTAASSVSSDHGAVNLWSGGALNLGTAAETDTSDYQSVNQSGGMFSSKTTAVTDRVVTQNAVGTVISGDTVSLRSQGDTILTGATVAASNGLSIVSAGAITIGAATNTREEDYQKTVTTNGLLSGGGIGFTIGERTQSTVSHITSNSLTGSIVGTLAGNSDVNAKTTYTQVASSLLSKDGNVNIQAGAVDIAAGQESGQQTVDTLFRQSGFTVAVGGGAIGALEGAVQSGSNLWDTASNANNGRVNALTAANAAVVGYQGYKAATGLVSQMESSGSRASGLSVSLTYGMSEATTHSVTNATQVVGSSISGQNVAIVATGANGTSGDLAITGSTLEASQNASLIAAHNLAITSAQNTHDNTTTNKSKSGSVGVAASVGQSGVAFGVTVSGAHGHGDANTSSVQQVNSEVNAGNTLSFASGANTTVAGAVLGANRVQGQVDGNLAIQSLQDTLTSHSTQTNVSASATFGYGASVSASYNHASSHANYANVVQQSGIEAGNGGFQVEVGNNTNLIGGLLTSSQSAVGAGVNALATGTLTTSDIQNTSSGSASTMGLGASLNTDATFGQSLDGDAGNNNYLAANGGKYGFGSAVVQNLLNNGGASSSSSGETLSAISPGNVQVHNTQPGVAQAIATLEANAQAVTNTQAVAPNVVALQKSAANEQTGNQLLFNVGSWVANQPALRAYLAGLQEVKHCDIGSGGKNCSPPTPLSGGYWMQDNSNANIFTNGIMNQQAEAGNNAGDSGVLYTTLGSASNTYVLNVYVPEVSGIASMLGGLLDSLNVNHAGGALGSTAGAQLNVDIAGQINQANAQGAGIHLTEFAHSDGTTQLAMAMMQNPMAFTNVNGQGISLVVMNAEGSTNAANEQATLNSLAINANVFYSALPTDPVPTFGLLGNNAPTGGNPQGLFVAGPAYYGQSGWGLGTSGLTGTSDHSNAWYSAAVIPVATTGSTTQYPWGFSGNSYTPGHAPIFLPASGASSDALLPEQFLQYGGSRTFATLSQVGGWNATYLNVPTYTVAGSTPWNVNITSLVWPGGATANLGSAMAAFNGLPVGVTTSQGMSAFAPGSSQPTTVSLSGNPPSSQTQQQKAATPAQQRCLVLTDNSVQCLQ